MPLTGGLRLAFTKSTGTLILHGERAPLAYYGSRIVVGLSSELRAASKSIGVIMDKRTCALPVNDDHMGHVDIND
jgi:hypothetical protein